MLNRLAFRTYRVPIICAGHCRNVIRLFSSKTGGDSEPSRRSRDVPSSFKPNELKKVEHVSPAVYSRVTFEYPPPPEPENIKPRESSPWRKHFPMMFGAGTVLWALYIYNHFFSGERDLENHILTPEEFSTFKITYKEDISHDTQLIELSPKYDKYREILQKKGTLWNGKRLWSIEVRQPQIQVVRDYTPLPLYYMQYKDGDQTKALLRMLGDEDDEGRMVLLVKKYQDGEVSRYLHELPVGSEVQIRGPYFRYKFPYSPIDKTPLRVPMEDVPSRMLPEFPAPEELPKPENVAFFAGGTGIAPILQSLLSKNPPRGNVDVYVSVRNKADLPVPRFLLFLEKAGRAKFHYFIDNENSFISSDQIPTPVNMYYDPRTIADKTQKELDHELEVQHMMQELRKEKGLKEPEPSETENPRLKYKSILDQVTDNKHQFYGQSPSLAIVCGPQGYVNYMAGDPGLNNDRPIGGLLATKGWTSANTSRMEN